MAVVPVYATSLLSGSVSNGANATGAPDGVWTTDSGNVSWTGTWAMGTPAADLAVGTTQTFKVLARLRPTGQNNPCTYTITVMNGATDIATSGALTPTEGGVTGSFSVNESQITNIADVRVRIDVTTPGGNPNSRTTAQIDAITWDADIQAVTGDLAATLDSTTAVVAATFPYYGSLDATLGNTALAASGFHPGADYAEPYYAEPYYAPTTAASTAPSGDIAATLDDTVADVQATRFPAYWIKIAGAVTIQAGEESFHAILQVDASNNGGWWFDEVRATVNGGANQLTNGLFETGDKTGWTGNAEQDGVVVPTESLFEPPGVYTLQLEADPTLPQLQSSDSFPVTAGDEVYVEAWAYFYGGVNSNGKATGRTKNASGDTVRTVVVAEASPPPDVVTGSLAATLDDTTANVSAQHGPGWIFLSGQTTVLAAETECRPRLRVNLGAATGGWHYDNVSCRLNGVEQLLNIGFETGDKTGWDSESAQAGTIELINGNYVLSIDVAATDQDQDANRFTCAEGDLVEASCWVKQYGTLDASSTAELVVSFLDAGVFQRYQNLDTADPDVGVVGDLAAQLDGTQAAATGDHGGAGDLSTLLDSTQAAATGDHGVAGDLTTSTDNTQAVISGIHGVAGDLAETLADTQAAMTGTTGESVDGDLAAVLADTQASFTGDHGAAGNLAAVLADTQASLTGDHGVAGNLAASTESTQASVAGSHGVAGDITTSTDDTQATANGSHGVAGDLATTLADTQAAFSGDFGEDVTGDLVAVLGDTQAAVNGSHGVAGDLAGSVDDTQAVATGSHGVAGDLVAGLEATDASMDGTFTEPGEGIIDADLADTTAAVSGQVGVAGPLASTLGDLSLDIVVDLGVAGTADATLDDAQASLSGTYEDSTRTGDLAATLEDTAFSATGDHYPAVVASIAIQLDSTALSVSGRHGTAGSLLAVMGDTTALFTFKPPSIGEPENPGVIDVTATLAVLQLLPVVGVTNVSKVVSVRGSLSAAGIVSISKQVDVVERTGGAGVQ